jgi:hypothetical protein
MEQNRGQRLYMIAQCQKVITRLFPESIMNLKSNNTWNVRLGHPQENIKN